MDENWDRYRKKIGRMPYKVVKGTICALSPRVDIDGRLYT